MNTTQKSKMVSLIVNEYMSEFTGNEIKVLLFLLESTDKYGRCYPTQKYISEKLGFTGEFLRLSIKHICETGLVKKNEIRYIDSKTNKPRHKNIYEFKLIPGDVQEDENDDELSEDYKVIKHFTKDDWFEDLDDVPHVVIERDEKLNSFYKDMPIDMLKIERSKHYKYYMRTGNESVIPVINAIVRSMPEDYEYEIESDPLLIVNDDWM